jgi:hypothetical protein
VPRILPALALLLVLAACGQLPRPFQHDETSDLAAPRAMRPIGVAEVPGQSGLAQAMVAALDHEDIAASVGVGGDRFLRLQGRVEAGRLRWRLADAQDSEIGAFDQPLDGRGAADLAAIAADRIGHLLRGDELGGADLANRPRLAIDKVAVVGDLDADLLKRALVTALERQGVAVTTAAAPLHVSGTVRITQGLAGHDLVEITWVVQDDKGAELGKVNQGSPVMRDELLAKAQQITHQIAEGGAEGIKQLVLTRR